jgi:hypothetical protein
MEVPQLVGHKVRCMFLGSACTSLNDDLGVQNCTGFSTMAGVYNIQFVIDIQSVWVKNT